MHRIKCKKGIKIFSLEIRRFLRILIFHSFCSLWERKFVLEFVMLCEWNSLFTFIWVRKWEKNNVYNHSSRAPSSNSHNDYSVLRVIFCNIFILKMFVCVDQNFKKWNSEILCTLFLYVWIRINSRCINKTVILKKIKFFCYILCFVNFQA